MIGMYSTCKYSVTGGAALRHSSGPYKISQPTLNHVRMTLACIFHKILHNAVGRTDRDAPSSKGPGGPPSRAYVNMGRSSITLPNLALQQYNS